MGPDSLRVPSVVEGVVNRSLRPSVHNHRQWELLGAVVIVARIEARRVDEPGVAGVAVAALAAELADDAHPQRGEAAVVGVGQPANNNIAAVLRRMQPNPDGSDIVASYWASPAPSAALQRKTSAGRENEDCEKRSVSPCGPATQTPPDECSATSIFGASLLCAAGFAEQTAEAMGDGRRLLCSRRPQVDAVYAVAAVVVRRHKERIAIRRPGEL